MSDRSEFEILAADMILPMLVKITAQNKVTLPESLLNEVGPARTFDVSVENGRIILTPVQAERGEAVRAKLAAVGIADRDVDKAVAYARGSLRRRTRRIRK